EPISRPGGCACLAARLTRGGEPGPTLASPHGVLASVEALGPAVRAQRTGGRAGAARGHPQHLVRPIRGRGARRGGLIELVERDDADLVCLQEVTAPLAGRLRASGAVREEMEVVCSSAVHTADGSMILSRLPIAAARELELPSIMNRALLAVEIATSAGTLTVATVHLESTRALAATRVAQLAEIFDALDDDTILAGDFNFDPRDPEEAALDPRFTDVWPLLRPSDPGYTEDTTRN